MSKYSAVPRVKDAGTARMISCAYTDAPYSARPGYSLLVPVLLLVLVMEILVIMISLVRTSTSANASV